MCPPLANGFLLPSRFLEPAPFPSIDKPSPLSTSLHHSWNRFTCITAIRYLLGACFCRGTSVDDVGPTDGESESRITCWSPPSPLTLCIAVTQGSTVISQTVMKICEWGGKRVGGKESSFVISYLYIQIQVFGIFGIFLIRYTAKIDFFSRENREWGKRHEKTT